MDRYKEITKITVKYNNGYRQERVTLYVVMVDIGYQQYVTGVLLGINKCPLSTYIHCCILL